MATGAWISGRLALDPRVPGSEKAPYNLRLVSNKRIKDRTTNEYTWKGEFYSCVVWGDNRKIVANLKKGDPILVVGRLEQTEYDKEGTTVQVVSIVADHIAIVPPTPDDGPTELPEAGDW